MAKKNLFLSFWDKFLTLPLWVKEVLYLNLQEDLLNYSFGLQYLDKNDIYQYYKPALTYLGKKELASRDSNLHPDIYKFMDSASQDLNIIEITLNNYWTLEETAKFNLECIDKEFVIPPSTKNSKAMALYLAGKIRIGEYFKRIDKIDVDQLDVAIRKQKELENAGQKKGMATVMIDLGYITEQDTKTVLYIKDEGKKRFIFNTDIISKSTTQASAPENIANAAPIGANSSNANNAVVEKLLRENTLLKNKLKAIINVIQGQ